MCLVTAGRGKRQRRRRHESGNRSSEPVPRRVRPRSASSADDAVVEEVGGTSMFAMCVFPSV